MFARYKLSSKDKVELDIKTKDAREDEYFSVNCPLIVHSECKYSAYMALFFFDKDHKEISRKIKWINKADFPNSPLEQFYKIIARADPKTNSVMFGFRINTEATTPSEIDIEIPEPTSIELNKIKPCKQFFDDLYDYRRLWSDADLKENYWDIVGPNSKEEFESSADSLFELLKKIGIRPESKILDVGCGTGRITSKLIGYLSDHGFYFGVDIAPEAIEFCEKHFRRENFKFLQNNFKKIPINNQKFDFVLIHSVFTHMYPDEIQVCLKECIKIVEKTSIILADIFITKESKDYFGDRGKMQYNEQFFINLVKKNNLKICELISHYANYEDRILYKINL